MLTHNALLESLNNDSIDILSGLASFLEDKVPGMYIDVLQKTAVRLHDMPGFGSHMLFFFSASRKIDLLRACLDYAYGNDYINQEVHSIIEKRLFALGRLPQTLLKKFRGRGSNLKADEAAIDLFLAMNERCRAFKYAPTSSYIDDTITIASNYLHRWFAVGSTSEHGNSVFGVGDGRLFCDLDTIAVNARFGPGASIGTRSTAYPEKIGCATLSYTSPWLYRWYLKSTLTSNTCFRAELRRADLAGGMLVRGSKVSTVPKSTEISRTICTEPSLNMFFQLGLGQTISDRLRVKTGIDIPVQSSRNKRLASLGSVNGRFATIDLKSASDTISLKLCRKLLPRDLFALILDLRSQRAEVRGDWVQLSMVSSMGNGFTFPLQTAIFTALVMATYQMKGIKALRPSSHDDGNFGVFGDDIVILTECFDHLTKVLDACGFIVNHDKSFSSGSFRESCGGDYLDGFNVRGIYAQNLAQPSSLYSLLNKFTHWSAQHGLTMYKTIHLILQHVKPIYVPPAEDISAGIQVPYDIARRYVRRERKRQALMYRKLSKEPTRRSMHRLNNAYAVVKALLRGDIERGYYIPRSEVVLFREVYGITSNWDAMGSVELLFDARLERWCQTMSDLFVTDRTTS